MYFQQLHLWSFLKFCCLFSIRVAPFSVTPRPQKGEVTISPTSVATQHTGLPAEGLGYSSVPLAQNLTGGRCVKDILQCRLNAAGCVTLGKSLFLWTSVSSSWNGEAIPVRIDCYNLGKCSAHSRHTTALTFCFINCQGNLLLQHPTCPHVLSSQNEQAGFHFNICFLLKYMGSTWPSTCVTRGLKGLSWGWPSARFSTRGLPRAAVILCSFAELFYDLWLCCASPWSAVHMNSVQQIFWLLFWSCLCHLPVPTGPEHSLPYSRRSCHQPTSASALLCRSTGSCPWVWVTLASAVYRHSCKVTGLDMHIWN